MRSFIATVPLSVLVTAIAIVATVVLSPAVASRLRTSRAIAALLVFGFGFVFAATLTPDAAAMVGEASDGVCDVSRMGLAPIGELTRISTTSLNVLLFVPLGMAVGLLPRTRTAAAVAIAAILLPFVVEAVQLVATPLGRGCQTADMVDNLLGLLLGIAIAALARSAFSLLRRSQV